MHHPPVRTITLGLEGAHPLSTAQITQAASRLEWARGHFSAAGYEVQTVRLSTRPLFDDLADWSASQILNYARDLQQTLSEVELGYCSLGQIGRASCRERL